MKKNNQINFMHSIKLLAGIIIVFVFAQKNFAQDTSDVMNQMEKEVAQNQINYTTATFKSTRIINGHSVETLPAHVLDLRISALRATQQRCV